MIKQALSLHNKGEFSHALLIYEKVLAQDPENPDAIHLVGHALLMMGKPAEAEPWVLKAVRVLPEAPVFYHTLGMVYEKLGDREKAIQAIEQCVSKDASFQPGKDMELKLKGLGPNAGPRIYINAEYGNRQCSIVLGIVNGQWDVQVIGNSDQSKIDNASIIKAAKEFLQKYLPLNPNDQLAESHHFSLQQVSISLFNWRDILCGRIKEIINDGVHEAETSKLGAFGFLANQNKAASKPTRLAFIEYAKKHPDKFEYIETDKFSPNMKNEVTYVDYKNRFKYIIDIPGHHFLTKLYWMLFTKRPIFYVNRELSYDWEKELKPHMHYIPLAEDLSDLMEKYEWAEAHPDECRKIAQNAFDYGMNQLSQTHVERRMADKIRTCITQSPKQEMNDLSGIKSMLEQHTRQLHNFYQSQSRYLYERMESLMALYHDLKPIAPFPSMSRYTSPVVCHYILNEIIARKPKTIVELGSGVTTLTSSYACKKYGEGRITAIDHEQQYLDNTRSHLQQHELTAYVDFYCCPLKQQNIGGGIWNWYDLSKATLPSKIDLLLVDGPPGHVQKNARFPAVPLLFDKLSEHAIVIIDDANHVDEQENIQTWMNEFKCFEREDYQNEKGIIILRKK